MALTASDKQCEVPGLGRAYGKPDGGQWQAGDRLVLRTWPNTRLIATDGLMRLQGAIASVEADMKANAAIS